MPTKTEISPRVLEDLGTTPDKVAATLRAYGIRGIRNSHRYFNPVVQYVYKQLGNHALHIDVRDGTTLAIVSSSGTKETALPPAVLSFLVRFNDGEYPDLEADESADMP